MSDELPLGTAIALDLVAPQLNARGGSARVFAPSPAVAAAAAAWLDPPFGETTVERILAVDLRAQDLPALVSSLAAGGTLAVVSPGGLAPLLGPLRGQQQAALGYESVVRSLEASGLAIAGPVHAIGGPSSLVWALCVRLAGRAGRADLADRWEFRHRRSLARHARPRIADVVAFLACRIGVSS